MIYLDSAATTLQKPPSVPKAVAQALATMTSPGRGNYGPAARASQTLLACREAAAERFRVGQPERVVLTFNATHGLNIAVRSLIKPGQTVVLSGYEHNAVTRPLHAIPNVTLTVLNTLPFQPERMIEELKTALAQGVDVVICNHVSNVFGCVQPVGEMAALCAEAGVPFVLDASQSAGILPVQMDELHAAFIAMPGHKGLYGPQGTGLLLCNHPVTPLLHGGTGSLSKLQTMPDMLPDRLESGTHNMPGIAGLLEGIRYVQRTGVETIAAHERRLTAQAVELLRYTEGIRLFWCEGFRHQTGVLSFVVEGMDCEELGEAMARQGVALRAGLHCAPLAHRTVGTLKTGTVRFSPSAFNTSAQVVQFAQILQNTLRKM